MKNVGCCFLIFCILYWACKPKEIPNQDSTRHEHYDTSHLQRVYPGVDDTTNLNDEVGSGNIGGIIAPYLPCNCGSVNNNYQLLFVGETMNNKLERFKNKHIFVSTSNTSRLNLEMVINDSNDTLYYESRRPVGKAGCSSICCDSKANLDSFHFMGKTYLNLPFAFHDKINLVTKSIDTLFNKEFRISEADYKIFNDSLKVYKVLECGVDSADFSYLNVFKKRQTIPIFRINQLKE